MSNPYEARILRVLKYIYDHPSADLSLDVLSDIAAMSRFHWHRVFQAMTGETCAQAVRRVRLQKAAMWLVSNSMPITKISKNVGYENSKSFVRAFTEMFGASPLAFRKRGTFSLPDVQFLKGEYKMFDVEIKDLKPVRLGAILHKGDYSKSGAAYEKLFATVNTNGLMTQMSGVVGVYYHNPEMTAEADLRCHAGVIMSKDAKLPKALEEVVLSGGSYAVLTFKGPYENIKTAYGYLFGRWLAESGREPLDAPCYESYLNSPMDTAPKDLLTHICLPLVA